MQHDPVHLIRPCAAYQALDGAASNTPPHEQAVYDHSELARPDEPGAGRVLYYRCRTCGSQLQRFTRAWAPDGWLVMPADLPSVRSGQH